MKHIGQSIIKVKIVYSGDFVLPGRKKEKWVNNAILDILYQYEKLPMRHGHENIMIYFPFIFRIKSWAT